MWMPRRLSYLRVGLVKFAALTKSSRSFVVFVFALNAQIFNPSSSVPHAASPWTWVTFFMSLLSEQARQAWCHKSVHPGGYSRCTRPVLWQQLPRDDGSKRIRGRRRGCDQGNNCYLCQQLFSVLSDNAKHLPKNGQTDVDEQISAAASDHEDADWGQQDCDDDEKDCRDHFGRIVSVKMYS